MKLFEHILKEHDAGGVPLVVDIETTTRGEGAKKSSPFHGNEIILIGNQYVHNSIGVTSTDVKRWVFAVNSDNSDTCFVGHNIKFDLNYLYDEGLDLNLPSSVWDTQLFEYLFSGQHQSMMSLEDACSIRGIPFTKDPDIKKWIEEGKDLYDFPLEQLNSYLVADLEATKQLYIKQLGLYKQQTKAFQNLFKIQCHFTKTLSHMEVAGTRIALTELLNLRKETINQYVQDTKDIADLVRKHVTPKGHMTSELANLSHTQSALLFGSPSKKPLVFSTKDPIGTYKNGNPKYKIQQHPFGIDRSKFVILSAKYCNTQLNALGTQFSLDVRVLS